MTTQTSSPRALSTHTPSAPAGSRLERFHSHQLRADRLNYVAIALGILVGLYVVVTIVRPLFFSTRPGKPTQDFGCISKSTVSDCSASSH
nr:hypothetical protein [uncultured Limnohabitans sp.]